MKQHKPAIDVLKGDSFAPRSDEPIAFVEEREKRVKELMEYLCTPSDAFKAERAFDMLENYISIYARVLYSTISNIIYEMQNAKETNSRLETLRANVDALLHYSEDKEQISHRKQCLPENHTPEMVDNTRKAVWKIWDHITLAYQQYVMLKQSDEEYDEKFKARIAGFKEEMSKEMNA